MGRIGDTFNTLRSQGKKALICYVMAGDPDMNATLKVYRSLKKAGADIVELGFPFSDPLADGPTIQEAANRALKNPITLSDYFNLLAEIRHEDQGPVILMTYYNLILRFGLEAFATEAQNSALDGIIIPDLPLEESASLLKALQKTDIDYIQLAAPTTASERITLMSKKGGGFLYYVSKTGITGTQSALSEHLIEQLEPVVNASELPVAVGFGVSSAEHARLISAKADGVVIGSALVKRLAEAASVEEGCRAIEQFLMPVANVLHGK